MSTLKFRPDWNRLGFSEHRPDYFDDLIAALKRGDNEGARAIADAHERAVKSVAFDAGRESQLQMSNEMFAELQIGMEAGVWANQNN